jgi:hypothetical protein
VPRAPSPGIEETSLRALAKLEQVFPSRLRRRVSALHSITVSLPGAGPPVDPAVLTVVARPPATGSRSGSATPATTEPRPAASGGDDTAYVSRSVLSAPYCYQARIRLYAPAREVAERIPPTAWQL